MTSPVRPEVEKMLVLSTSHMPETEPDFGGTRAEPHQYGYIIFLMSADSTTDAAWLQPIIDRAYELGCRYINFDADADQLDGFPSWDW